MPCTALIGLGSSALICAEVFIPERDSQIETQVTFESRPDGGFEGNNLERPFAYKGRRRFLLTISGNGLCSSW
jgi:hypothetical protein